MILLFHIVQTDWISMGYLINALIHTEATMPQALFEVVVVTAIACIISVLLQRSSKHASNAAVFNLCCLCRYHYRRFSWANQYFHANCSDGFSWISASRTWTASQHALLGTPF